MLSAIECPPVNATTLWQEDFFRSANRFGSAKNRASVGWWDDARASWTKSVGEELSSPAGGRAPAAWSAVEALASPVGGQSPTPSPHHSVRLAPVSASRRSTTPQKSPRPMGMSNVRLPPLSLRPLQVAVQKERSRPHSAPKRAARPKPTQRKRHTLTSLPRHCDGRQPRTTVGTLLNVPRRYPQTFYKPTYDQAKADLNELLAAAKRSN